MTDSPAFFVFNDLDALEESRPIILQNVSHFEFIWCFLIRMKLHIFGKNPGKWCPSQCIVYWGMWYCCSATGNINSDHMAKVVSARFCYCKIAISSFENNKYLVGEIYEGHASILFYIKLSPANVLANINVSCLQWLLLWYVIMLIFHFSYSSTFIN